MTLADIEGQTASSRERDAPRDALAAPDGAREAEDRRDDPHHGAGRPRCEREARSEPTMARSALGFSGHLLEDATTMRPS